MERSSGADERRADEGGKQGGTHPGVEAEGRAINSQNGEGYSRGWPHISPPCPPYTPRSPCRRHRRHPPPPSPRRFASPSASLRRRHRRRDSTSPPLPRSPAQATGSLLISTGVRGIRRRSTEIRRSSRRENAVVCASGLVDARHVCLLGRLEHICRSQRAHTYLCIYLSRTNTYIYMYIFYIYVLASKPARTRPRYIYKYIYIFDTYTRARMYVFTSANAHKRAPRLSDDVNARGIRNRIFPRPHLSAFPLNPLGSRGI